MAQLNDFNAALPQVSGNKLNKFEVDQMNDCQDT